MELNAARNYILKLLSKRLYSQKEIVDKLKRRRTSDSDIRHLLAYLKELNLLNDETVAKAVLKKYTQIRGRGRGWIYDKMRQRGIPKEMIESSLAERSQDKEFELAVDEAKKLLELNIDGQSLARRLINRGFSRKIVFEVLNKLGLKF